MCELFHIVFASDLINKLSKLESGKKDNIINQIKDEFKPDPRSEDILIQWIKDHMMDAMKH